MPFDLSTAKPAGGFDLATASEVPQNEPSMMARTRAAASGINRGFYSDLLGLPVDTIQNILDLGRAAVGTGANLIGKPELAPDLPNRENIVGSSEWIARKINEAGLSGAITNPNPQDQASRILHMGGRVAGASAVPMPGLTAGQQAANIAKGGAGGLLAGATGEVAPEWAGVAGMAPQMVSALATRGVAQAIRGDEAGRRNMQQRIADLKAGGVDEPSLGLASGNRTVQGLENMLAQTPGSIGIYEAARNKNIAGMKEKTAALRDTLSPDYGAQVAGEAIQGSIKNDFVNRFKATQENLYGALDKLIAPSKKVPVTNTAGTLQGLTAGIEGAPNIGQRFVNQRISGINDALRQDTGLTYTPGSAVLGEGAWRPPTTPTLPYQAVKQLRTEVGAELSNNALTADVPRGQWKQLYAGLSEDMRNAATNTGPEAQQAFNRANAYTQRGLGRMEDLTSLANRPTPESAYQAVASSLKSGSTVYDRLRGALTPDARKKVVATVIDELGGATPGTQNAAGDVWSPRSFLTNYNKMEGGAREALFKRIPGGEGMQNDLAKIAKTAEMLGDSSQIWSNPSGTAPALVARGTLGTIGAGLVGGLFYTPLIAPAATAAGGLVAANQLSQRLLLNPKFVNWLAKAPPVKTQAEAQAYAQRLVANARMTNDPQFSQDVQQYLQSVQPEQ